MTAVCGVESYIVLASNEKKNQKTKLLEDNVNRKLCILQDCLNHTHTYTRVVIININDSTIVPHANIM